MRVDQLTVNEYCEHVLSPPGESGESHMNYIELSHGEVFKKEGTLLNILSEQSQQLKMPLPQLSLGHLWHLSPWLHGIKHAMAH